MIIIGAGPAGAAAAYFLAKGGARVVLLDKQRFPRDKICGDGLTSPSLGVLERMGLGDWVCNFNAPDTLLLSSPNYDSVKIRPPDENFCYGRVVPRLTLDYELLKRAVEAGASLYEETSPVEFERLSSEWVSVTVKHLKKNVSTKHTSTKFKGHLVICADGVHGSFTKKLGLIKGLPDLVAVRAYFEDVGTVHNVLEIHLDDTVTPGYAWIFPSNDGRANVGLGTFASRTKREKINLRAALDQFLQNNPHARSRLKPDRQIGKTVGFPIRTRMQDSVPVADNILVVGEAAGVVDPITGDGISEALETGEFAAHQALMSLAQADFSEKALIPYKKWLQKHYGTKHSSALMMRNLLGYNRLVNRLVQRAQTDATFALNLAYMMIGFKPTYHMLNPRSSECCSGHRE
ncbi:MAG: geranylgeranyl reductase family protein [Chloroflexota bacterium]